MQKSNDKYGTSVPKTSVVMASHPNTELCVDLKTVRCVAGRMYDGECLNGMLRRDEEMHFTFIEHARKAAVPVRRNPIVYKGACINVHRDEEGNVYPRFTRPQLSGGYSFQDFCRQAIRELRTVGGLGGEEVNV